MKLEPGQVIRNTRILMQLRTDEKLNKIWLCECTICGKKFERSTSNINRLITNPCGCFWRNPNNTNISKAYKETVIKELAEFDYITLKCHTCPNELKTNYRTIYVGNMLKCASEHKWLYDDLTGRMTCPDCIKKNRGNSFAGILSTAKSNRISQGAAK